MTPSDSAPTTDVPLWTLVDVYRRQGDLFESARDLLASDIQHLEVVRRRGEAWRRACADALRSAERSA